MRPYAYFKGPEGRRNPAFDTDIHLYRTPEDLDRLTAWCEEAGEERPDLPYVVVDLDHRRDPDGPFDTGGVIGVFGRLLREQDEAIDPEQVRAQAQGPRARTWHTRRVCDRRRDAMTLEEILALGEERPCPGCPVCAPMLPRGRRKHRAVPAPRSFAGAVPSDPRRTATSRSAEHQTQGARPMELEKDCGAGIGPDPEDLPDPNAQANLDVRNGAVFYVARSSGPDEAPFYTEGAMVEAGVPVASPEEVGAERFFPFFAGPALSEVAGYA